MVYPCVSPCCCCSCKGATAHTTSPPTPALCPGSKDIDLSHTTNLLLNQPELWPVTSRVPPDCNRAGESGRRDVWCPPRTTLLLQHAPAESLSWLLFLFHTSDSRLPSSTLKVATVQSTKSTSTPRIFPSRAFRFLSSCFLVPFPPEETRC